MEKYYIKVSWSPKTRKKILRLICFLPNKITDDCLAADREIKKTEKLKGSTKITERISEGFRYVIVGLYDDNGRILFGEITFYPWSGYVQNNILEEAEYMFAKGLSLVKRGKLVLFCNHINRCAFNSMEVA